MKKVNPQKNNNGYSFEEIMKKAYEILGKSSNRNPFYLALMNGARIAEERLTIPGFTCDNTIYINKNLDTYSKKIVCAHELGHYILHIKETDFNLFDMESNMQLEYEANLFACTIFPQMIARMDKNGIHSKSDFNKYIENQVMNKMH